MLHSENVKEGSVRQELLDISIFANVYKDGGHKGRESQRHEPWATRGRSWHLTKITKSAVENVLSKGS